jgi:potassium intermediate/small conductance calcium-activated channel subfamily N protein 2
VWFRYHYLLYIDQCIGKRLKRQSFFCFEYFGYFLIESLIALIHPNIFLKNKKIKFPENIFRTETTYYINDIFLIVSLFRSYVLIRFTIDVFKFYSPRTSRIAKLIGSRLTRLFVVKCILNNYPFTFLIIVTLVSLFSSSYMLRIAETPAYEKYINEVEIDDSSSSFSSLEIELEVNNNDYRKIINCIWNIMITMTTVGYGDYYPITLLGKLICVLMSVWGTCVTSFMLMFLQNLLTMSDNEEEALYEKEKSHLKSIYDKRSLELFISGLKYVNARRKYMKSLKGKYPKKLVIKLKNNLEDALYNRIEKRRKFREICQLYKNTYEFYKDEEILKDILNKFQNMLTTVEKNGNELNNLIQIINTSLDCIEDEHKKKNFFP